MKKVSGFLLITIAVLILGGVVLSSRPAPQYQAAMNDLRLDTATKMARLKIAFCYGLAAVVVLGLAGGGVMLLRYIWQRTNLIRAQDGLFPVVRGRAAGQTYYHDPNRQWAEAVAKAMRQKVIE